MNLITRGLGAKQSLVILGFGTSLPKPSPSDPVFGGGILAPPSSLESEVIRYVINTELIEVKRDLIKISMTANLASVDIGIIEISLN